MNKAIQYREDGKFYGLVNVPERIDEKDYRRHRAPGFNDFISADSNYHNELKTCIAAGKEIINPEVVVKEQTEGLWVKRKDFYTSCTIIKPGDIFDCPDNIEFEEVEIEYTSESYKIYGERFGNKIFVIRLKLKP